MTGDGNNFNSITGNDNTTGDFVYSSSISGANNSLPSGAGIPPVSDPLRSVHVLGSDNTVTGQTSHRNIVLGHNANVEGANNFVGGGNDVSGPSVTGDNNIVLGAGASSVVDHGVAIGSGSAAGGE